MSDFNGISGKTIFKATGNPNNSAWSAASAGVVAAFGRACGRELPYEFAPRRPGDVASCWADPAHAESTLGWRATRSLDEMCADTWRWQSMNPNGYPG